MNFVIYKVELKMDKRDYSIFSYGELKRNENSLKFINYEGIKKDIPINDIDNLYLFSELTFNTKLINFISKFEINMHFYNYYGFYTGSFYPKEVNNSGYLFINQVKYYTSKKKRLYLAQKILEAGIKNILKNLKYYNNRNKKLENEISKIKELLYKINTTNSIFELMGLEGNIRKIYYCAFNIIIDKDINFKKRVRQPPDNIINCLISFVNSLLYTMILGEIYKTQLTPLVSFLHQPGVKKFPLSLDIAEIFKPIIADKLIFSLLNKNLINESCFERGLNFTYLNEKGRKIVKREFDNKLSVKIFHRDLRRKVSYKYLLRLELYKIIKHIIGEKDYNGFVMWW